MARGRQTLFDILGSRGRDVQPAVDRRSAKAGKKTRKRAPAAATPGDGEVLMPLRALVVAGCLLLVAGGAVGYGLGRSTEEAPALDTRREAVKYAVRVFSSDQLPPRPTQADTERIARQAWAEADHLEKTLGYAPAVVKRSSAERCNIVLVGKTPTLSQAESLRDRLRYEQRTDGEHYRDLSIVKIRP